MYVPSHVFLKDKDNREALLVNPFCQPCYVGGFLFALLYVTCFCTENLRDHTKEEVARHP